MSVRKFKTVGAARKAIKAAGLDGMAVRYDKTGGRFSPDNSITPAVLCDLPEDFAEVGKRGFAAEMKRTRIEEGATVRLKPGFPRKKDGELAVVIGFLTEKAGGGVALDRPLDGCIHWAEDALELIARETEA